MRKIFFKPFSATLIALLFCAYNLLLADSFIVLAPVKQKIVDKSYHKLMTNKERQASGNFVNLNEAFESYKKNYGPNSYNPIFKKDDTIIINKSKDPHFTLAEVGEVIIKGGREYVKSYVTGQDVLLDDAVSAVRKAINTFTYELAPRIYLKDSYNPPYSYGHYIKSKSFYPPISFILEDGTKFMYNPNDPTSKTKTNVWISQEVTVGENLRLKALGEEIIKELALMGLPSKHTTFTPHLSITNISAINTLQPKNPSMRNYNVINLLKYFEQDPNNELSKILKSVKRKKGKRHFDTIEIRTSRAGTYKTFKLTADGVTEDRKPLTPEKKESFIPSSSYRIEQIPHGGKPAFTNRPVVVPEPSWKEQPSQYPSQYIDESKKQKEDEIHEYQTRMFGSHYQQNQPTQTERKEERKPSLEKRPSMQETLLQEKLDKISALNHDLEYFKNRPDYVAIIKKEILQLTAEITNLLS
jgi:hypothetical protein